MSDTSVFTVHPHILRFEKEIRYRIDTEVIGFFTEDGILLLTLQGKCIPGKGCRTVIPDSALETICGQIMTHNHPSDASFTGKDLREASFFSMREIRVVGRTGAFSMQPGPGGWPPPPEIAARFDEIWNSPALESRVVRMMDEKAGYNGDIPEIGATIAAAGIRVRSDLCCELLAEELHLTYRKGCWQS